MTYSKALEEMQKIRNELKELNLANKKMRLFSKKTSIKAQQSSPRFIREMLEEYNKHPFSEGLIKLRDALDSIDKTLNNSGFKSSRLLGQLERIHTLIDELEASFLIDIMNANVEGEL